MEQHEFKPSRPDGVVCVVERAYHAETNSTEVCGYPAGHPIHAMPAACFQIGGMCATHDRHISYCQSATPAEARTGISDRVAAALQDVTDFRLDFDDIIFIDANVSVRTGEWDARLARIEQALRDAR